MARNRCYLLIAIFTFIAVSHTNAQKFLRSFDTSHNLKRFRLLGFPFASYSPETRIDVGLAGIALFRFGQDAVNTAPSQIGLAFGYSQNKQQMYSSTFQLYTNRNMFSIYGEAGYYKYSYYFYGIGTHQIPSENYSANYPRIKITALYKWAPHYYAGVRYQYENYDVVQTVPGGELASGTIPGSKGSISNGAGIVQVLDTRDTVLYPTKGCWMELALIVNPTFLGSTNTYGQYSYDVTWYKKVYKSIVWANELYTKIVNGDAPFEQYALLGGYKKLRGFYEGQFRDKHSLILQTEFRSQIYKRFGAAVFGGVGFLGSDGQYVRFNLPEFAYGAGLRYIINKNDHLNLRLDYAIGNGQGQFYATFGEAF